MLKNAYIKHLVLQKVGHKVREEANIFATKTTEFDESKEDQLIPFLFGPFRKNLELKQFAHYTDKLEFNKVYNLCKSMLDEEIDFVDFSNEVLKTLYDQSLHPQIKSGEVFTVQLNNAQFDGIPCKAIGIYKLENKSKFLRFDERETIDYNVLKGYKLDKLDKGVLILDAYRDEGFRVYTIDDKNVESEFWTKNFLEVKPVTNPALQTKKFLETINDFAIDVVLDKTNRKDQAEFLSNSIDLLSNHEFVDIEIIDETLGEYKDDFNQYLNQADLKLDKEFEVDSGVLITQSKKIKSEIKLDTGAKINLDLLNSECAADNLERGYDDEKKMFYYKVYFNSEA
ncbi:37-kD nucleoid-associated bacterial protein [Algoriella xinjiangensis]|uniref:nucleoid-associated protein n=1 Tax=Algoriella xinjiangensis TaxID=684065 RepID=UPI000F642EDE|nr:nucleoid-associated protein [Algoriella xinjiangensis]VDH16135.1 37-kD nucleoid-associated bacterial protein [Algoriella xinjiangensis]